MQSEGVRRCGARRKDEMPLTVENARVVPSAVYHVPAHIRSIKLVHFLMVYLMASCRKSLVDFRKVGGFLG